MGSYLETTKTYRFQSLLETNKEIMTYLNQLIPDEDIELNQSKANNPKLYNPSKTQDLGSGIKYGFLRGGYSLPNAVDRVINGDEVADEVLNTIDKTIKPVKQNKVGQVASGITEVVTQATLGSVAGIAGVATTTAAGSYSSEHARLTAAGVDPDIADSASAIYAGANTLLTVIPIANIIKGNTLSASAKDYAVSVIPATIAGQAASYAEGKVLSSSGHEDLGKQYMNAATDPTHIAINLGIGSIMHFGARYVATRDSKDTTVDQVNDAETQFNQVVDDAQRQADIAAMPTKSENVVDLVQHENNLNTSIKQVLDDDKVSVKPTGGTPKPISQQQFKDFVKPKPIKPQFQGVQKSIYDEATALGLSDDQARTVLAIAHFETGGTFSNTIKNKQSSATGVFQFINDTWTAAGGTKANRFDLATQIKLGVKHQLDNIKYIQDKTGHTLTGGEIYLPHLLGKGGATKVIAALKADPNKSAREVISTFSKKPDRLMKINGIAKNATIEQAVKQFTNKIEGIATKTYGRDAANPTEVVAPNQPTVKPIENTIDPVMPKTEELGIARDDDHIDSLLNGRSIIDDMDIAAFEAKHTVIEDPAVLNTPEHITTKPDNTAAELEAVIKPTKDATFSRDPIDQQALTVKQEQPIKAQRINSEDPVLVRDNSLNAAEKIPSKAIPSDGSFSPKPIKSSDTTTTHSAPKQADIPDQIHPYGYLSQIPKGQAIIKSLEANPDMVIASQAGKDFTANDWQARLQKEQENIQLMTKAMKTLATCALKGTT